METFYLQTRPKLSVDAIKTMLVGRGKVKGLIHFCGKLDPESPTHLVCAVGLNLLNVFLDYSTCPGIFYHYLNELLDAEQFINLLGSLSLKYLQLLFLNHHIEGKSQKQCKSSALKIVDLYLNRNPSLSAKEIVHCTYDLLIGSLQWTQHFVSMKNGNNQKSTIH